MARRRSKTSPRPRSHLVHAWIVTLAAVAGVSLSSCVTPGGKGDSVTPQTVADDANAEMDLDTQIQAHWARAGVTPAAEASDAEFMRRVYLDLVGRVPTEQEARTFLHHVSGQGKRRHLVHKLLEDPGFAEHWSDVYADLLIGLEPGGQSRRLHSSFHTWWAQQLQARTPYDQMVEQIITAAGEFAIDDAGPAAFMFRHGRKNRIEGVTTQASRVFLGVQLGCAQCHDHPYDDRYKQEDFYAMGAFFAQTRARLQKGPEGRGLRVLDRPRGEAHLPNADGSPGRVVAPKFLDKSYAQNPEGTRREQLAGAMLDSELLAKTLVNHTWAQLFGRGLVEPWDDLGGIADASHPPVLNYLAQQLIERGYDFHWLVEEIVCSQAYQRTSIGDPDTKAEQAFARAAVRPLSPRQLFRSLIVATGLEDSKHPSVRKRVEARREQALREYLFVFADDEAAQVDAFSGNVPQALLLLNGELGNRGVNVGVSPTVDRALGFYREDKAGRARPQAVASLILTAYGRDPEFTEAGYLERFLAEANDSPAAFEDLFFSLLLSSEFQTNH